MVVLETALIGTAGYAAYRGGEKAAHVGGRKMEDLKRDRKRNEKKRDYDVKSRERSTRLHDIQNKIETTKKSGSILTASSSTTSGSTTAAAAASSNAGSMTREAADDRLQKERFNSIKERYGDAHAKHHKKKGILGTLFGSKKK